MKEQARYTLCIQSTPVILDTPGTTVLYSLIVIFDHVTVKTPNSAKRIDGEQNCLLIVWYERRRKKIKFVISVWTWKTLMCAWLIDKVASHIFDTIPCMTTHEKHSIGYSGHNFENLVSDQKCKQPF